MQSAYNLYYVGMRIATSPGSFQTRRTVSFYALRQPGEKHSPYLRFSLLWVVWRIFLRAMANFLLLPGFQAIATGALGTKTSQQLDKELYSLKKLICAQRLPGSPEPDAELPE